MGDYHILTQDDKKRTISAVFHILVPIAGTNEAGLTWWQAVVGELGGSAAIVSVLPGISVAEDTQLKAGKIIEKVETVRFTSVNLTKGQRKAEIEAYFNELKTDLIAEKQIILEWMGYEGMVA